MRPRRRRVPDGQDGPAPLTTSPRRLVRPDPEECAAVLALIQAAFAYMEDRIDPPSSMHRLTPESVAAMAASAEIWVIGAGAAPDACVFLTPEADRLYLGKLAVRERARGQGLGRRLVEHAMVRAAALGLPAVELQTRIELAENHATFAHMGFRKVGETAHAGYDRPTSITMRRDVESPAES